MATLRNKATLDSTQFQSGLKGMQGQVKNLGQSMRSLPGLGSALSTAAIAAAANQAMNYADEIDNLSIRMGLGVETVQAYKIGLEEAGLSMGDLESASTRLERAQNEAIAGNKTYQKSFVDLGISQKRLSQLNTEDLLGEVGQQMGRLSGNADATAGSYQLLGRSAGRLRQVLIDLNKDGIQAQIDDLKRLGLMYDENMIKKLDAAQLRVERFGRQASATAAKAFSGLIERMEFVGARLGGASAEEAYAITQQPVEDAKKSKDEQTKRELEERKRQIEANANSELQALEEKRRLESLTGDELRKELAAKLEIARAEMDQANSKVEQLNALKEIHDLEGRIAGIKKDSVEKPADKPESEREFSSLRRIGANMMGTGNREIAQQTGLMRRQVDLQDKGWRVLQEIRDNMLNGGAVL